MFLYYILNRKIRSYFKFSPSACIMANDNLSFLSKSKIQYAHLSCTWENNNVYKYWGSCISPFVSALFYLLRFRLVRHAILRISTEHFHTHTAAVSVNFRQKFRLGSHEQNENEANENYTNRSCSNSVGFGKRTLIAWNARQNTGKKKYICFRLNYVHYYIFPCSAKKYQNLIRNYPTAIFIVLLLNTLYT